MSARLFAGLAALVALSAIAAPALAQGESDPSLNESEMDGSVPPSDESYLDDDSDWEAGSANSTSSGSPETTSSEEADVTLEEDALDGSVPAADTSYLDDEYDFDESSASDDAASGGSGDASKRDAKVPGAGVGLLVAGAFALAVVLNRRN